MTTTADEVAALEAREATAWERLEREAGNRGWQRHFRRIAEEMGRDVGPMKAVLTLKAYRRIAGYEARAIMDSDTGRPHRDRLPLYRPGETTSVVDLLVSFYVADVVIERQVQDRCTCEEITAVDYSRALAAHGVTDIVQDMTARAGGGCMYCA